MKKRTAFIGAILSLIPLGQPLLIKTGVVLSTTSLMLSIPENVFAKNAKYYIKSAQKKAEKGDHYGAISDYTKAIEINPKKVNARDNSYYFDRALDKGENGDHYGAISDYTKAIEINPMDVDAYNNIAFIKRKKEINDNYGAIFYATKAIEINPNHSNAYLNRGVAKQNLGDMNGACDDSRKASSLGNESTAEWVRDQC